MTSVATINASTQFNEHAHDAMDTAVGGVQGHLLAELLPERAAIEVIIFDRLFTSHSCFWVTPTRPSAKFQSRMHRLQGMSSSVVQEYLDRLEARRGQVRCMARPKLVMAGSPHDSH